MSNVDHPDHYNKTDRECVTVVEHMRFNTGSAMKYLWRMGEKGDPVEDVEKAQWYVVRELDRAARAVSPTAPDFDVVPYLLETFPGLRGRAMASLWMADKIANDFSHLMMAVQHMETLRIRMQDEAPA